MKDIAIFDLDGTLFPIPELTWEPDNFKWDKFLEVMDEQSPFVNTINMVDLHKSEGCEIVVVTARPERERSRTIDLLALNGVKFDTLIMRADDLIDAETIEVEAATSQEEVKDIIHSNHSVWRVGVRDFLIDAQRNIVAAYDDQKDNLRVWYQGGAATHLVDGNGIIMEYGDVW